MGEYHAFTGNDPGIVSFSDERLDFAYRVEADFAVQYANPSGASGAGVYVGRRSWPDRGFKNESLLVFGTGALASTSKINEPALRTFADLYWWERDENGSTKTLVEKHTAWGDPKLNKVRFVKLVIDVRETEVIATIDGSTTTISEQRVVKELADVAKTRQGFPGYDFTPPAFGSGVGICCLQSTCVVRNLTVSKLP